MNIVYLLVIAKFGKGRLVAGQLVKYPQIKAVHEVFGRFDIIIKVVGKNIGEIEKFIQNKIRTMENIEKAETLVVSNADSGRDEEDEFDEEPDAEDFIR